MIDTAHLAANWAAVRRRVDDACLEAGRDLREVSILPVSKTFGPEVVRAALALGLRRFGENKVQEIKEKATALAGEAIDQFRARHIVHDTVLLQTAIQLQIFKLE